MGYFAGPGSANLENATAIGAYASVTQSNSLVLGGINGINGAFANTYVGIGTTAPGNKLVVDIGPSAPVDSGVTITGSTNTNGDLGLRINNTGTGGKEWYIDSTNNNSGYGGSKLAFVNTVGTSPVMVLTSTSRVGIGTLAPDQTLSVGTGDASKPGGGSWLMFSDERRKNIKGRFTPGLKAVMQLQPLRYEYKPDNALGIKSEGEHVGFGAQAVQKIIPEAVSKSEKGYLLVNNDPIIWTMLNAIKEQQKEIETLRAANATLSKRLQSVEKSLLKRGASGPRRRR
jgi:hypothetical protein